MNARFAIAAFFATILSALAVSTSWGQNWSVDPNTGRPYAGTITTTTITTYAPANQETVNYTPQAVYSVPAYNSPVDVAPTYQSDYQPSYQPSVAPAYVPQQAPVQEYVPQAVQTQQPIVAMSVATPSVQTVNYVQPVSYYRPYEHYEHHEHVRPVYYGAAYTAAYAPAYVRPAYYAAAPVVRPVYAPVYTPTVSYATAFAPAPVPAYAAPAYAGGPQVWVHPKVYVQGEPVRNLIRAITP